jgi:N-acyl-D-aspartate/D-glutamate deacylase
MPQLKLCALLTALLLLPATAFSQTQYDIVLHNGRVIDPETSFDAVRDVGISNGEIAAISEQPLSGKRVIDATGLVVAPGFIDLHQHDLSPEGMRLKAMDGVTTALELEIGPPDVSKFLAERQGKSLINFGTSASHPWARATVMGHEPAPGELIPSSGDATNKPATPEQIQSMQQRLRNQIDAGGLGVGMGIQYTPGATRTEIIDMFRVAAEQNIPVFVHMRGDRVESVSEVIAAAAVTGAPLHIVHINSSCLRESPECLRMVAGARAQGLDVTTEAYPYIAGMTQINSALFNPGWQEKIQATYSDIMIPGTGQRLTKERFDELHASPKPQLVIIFNNSQTVVDGILENPLVMVASDGGPGHPRNAGTYGRFYDMYVRQRGTVTIMEAVRKMSYMPAVRLEKSTPQARKKGRLQVGADADVVVFDPRTFKDQSTFEKPSVPSIGVRFLLVNGTAVVDGGKLMEGAVPGRALTTPTGHR